MVGKKEFDKVSLLKDIRTEAKALGIPSGAAESFAEMVVSQVQETIKDKKIITQNDLIRETAKELKKYNPDLAYVYKNRGKII